MRALAHDVQLVAVRLGGAGLLRKVEVLEEKEEKDSGLRNRICLSCNALLHILLQMGLSELFQTGKKASCWHGLFSRRASQGGQILKIGLSKVTWPFKI